MASASLRALPATELRRLIGTKEISPVELLASCIARIEALNPAVNAIAAKAYDRARAEAVQAEAAALNGVPLGRLHGLPIGIKDLQDTAGRAHDPRLAAVPRPRAGAGFGAGGAGAGRGRDRDGEDQRAGVRRRCQLAQPGLGRHRQPFRSVR